MRVAVTGTTGRVGAALAKWFAGGHEVISLPRAEFDLADPAAMRSRLDSLECDLFLNPGGLTSLEACEDDPAMARRVNVEAPVELAAWAAGRGVKLVHFSTDYVFGGRTPELRTEEEKPEPLSVYGATKLAGEEAVLAYSGNLVLRVSWVFGPEKPSFLDAVIRDALAGKPLAAVVDKYSLPTHTRDLSGWVERLVDHQASGLFHACQSGSPVSWHGMAGLVVGELVRTGRLSHLPEIQAMTLQGTTAFRAERPRYSAMSSAKLQATAGCEIRDWRETVLEYVGESR